MLSPKKYIMVYSNDKSHTTKEVKDGITRQERGSIWTACGAKISTREKKEHRIYLMNATVSYGLEVDLQMVKSLFTLYEEIHWPRLSTLTLKQCAEKTWAHIKYNVCRTHPHSEIQYS